MIKKAIQKAIEGGYNSDKRLYKLNDGFDIPYVKMENGIYRYEYVFGYTNTGVGTQVPLTDILLDPLFWQSLVRTLLKENPRKMHRMFNITPTISEGLLKNVAMKLNKDFIEHIHDDINKDPESFFSELLKETEGLIK